MDQVDEIKSKLDIVEFVSSYVTLKKSGHNHKGLCPFHAEKTPSFMVNGERQIWHCFGCAEGGDIFGFLMKYENLEFVEALRILAEKAGVTLQQEYREAGKSKKDILTAINHSASELYHYLLLSNDVGKNALEYLKRRKITDDSIKKFKLGYAPRSWDTVGKFLAKKGYSLSDIEAAGMIISKSGGRGYYDRFRGRLMFPVFSHLGLTLGFSGRILTESKTEPKYMNTPETMIYNKGQIVFGLHLAKEAIKKENEAILVEGNLDVVSSHQAGVSNTVAPLGSALTMEQIRALRRYSDQLSLSFDTDKAGQEAAKRAIDIAEKAGMSTKVILIEGAKDPDELVRKDPLLWKEAVKKGIPSYEFLLDSLFSKYDGDSAYGKKKIGEEGIILLASIESALTRAQYIKKLAEKLKLTEEVIATAVNKSLIGKLSTTTINEVMKQAESDSQRRKMLELYLLSLVLKLGSLALDKIGPSEVEFHDLVSQEVYDALKKEKKGQFDIRAFCDKLKPEVVPFVDELYLREWGGDEDELKVADLEMALKEMEKLQLKDEIELLSGRIAVAEKSGQETILGELGKEFTLLSQRLANLQTE